MRNILITGSSGLLGKSLKHYFNKKNISYFIFKRGKKNNFLNKKFILSYLKKKKIEVIINLSALTNIDECSKKKKLCRNVNYKLVKNICNTITKFNLNIFLIQISTDQFYNNYDKNFEFNYNLLNYYSKTKFQAEIECKKISSVILRTNFFGYGNHSKRLSLSDWIYKNLKNNKKIFLADDILFSPISINTLCKIIYLCFKKRINGVFNVGSRNGMSKFRFGKLFAKYLKLNSKLIIKCKMSELNFKEKRPKDMRMKIRKFEKFFSYRLPNLRDEIKSQVDLYV